VRQTGSVGLGDTTEAGTSPRFLLGVAILAAICLGSGLGVGVLYVSMKDDIAENERSVFVETLAVVLGEAEDYPAVGDYPETVPEGERVYGVPVPDGALYAATGTAQGYQSTVKVLVAVKADRIGEPPGADPVIHCMAVVSSQETPGLGENIKHVERDVSLWGAIAGQKSVAKRPWFQEQFTGRRLGDLIVEKSRDTSKIAAVTGATITSEAATQATRNAIERILKRTREVYER
jgi:Na+-translocating ferredoxin:NAD+ oxidoreductase RnfG subunit